MGRTLAVVNRLVTIALAAAALACGPSFQMVYEGDARFEHCYALEDTANASMTDKAECWREWTQHHTYGQTRDRVEYAASRFRALTTPNMPTDEAMMAAAPGVVDTGNQLVAPAPTSAFAPPPVTTAGATTNAAASAAPAISSVPVAPTHTAPAAPRPPAADCLDGCTAQWQSCSDAKPKCEKSYDKCASECVSKKR